MDRPDSDRFDADAWPPGFRVMMEDPNAEHSIRLVRRTGTELVCCKCGWEEALANRLWSAAPAIYLRHLVPEQRNGD